ncbi:hypothetical protein [Halobellus salinisoli]|uniref:hypothetical protein n=1 Tax=Halobellus salinisoli TaxID=3108500 RepID=UPI003009DBE8
MTECSRCGESEDVENGRIVGQFDHWDQAVCNRCRATELADHTPLVEEEAEVKAVRQLTERSLDTIADLLDLDESTVKMKLRVVEKRINNGQVTRETLLTQNIG